MDKVRLKCGLSKVEGRREKGRRRRDSWESLKEVRGKKRVGEKEKKSGRGGKGRKEDGVEPWDERSQAFFLKEGWVLEPASWHRFLFVVGGMAA